MSNVINIFQTMNYGPIEEDCNETQKWLLSRKFGPFISGKWRIANDANIHNIENPWTGNILATVRTTTSQDIKDAIESAVSEYTVQKDRSASNVFKFLHSIAGLLEKHSQLFSQVDSLNHGVQVKDSREFDLPSMVKYFKYYSSSSYDTSSVNKLLYEPVTVGIMTKNTPLVALAWLLAPAFAAHSCVCLVVPYETSLSAMIFAHICIEASGFDGVLSVLPGDQSTIDEIVTHKKVSNVVCFGPTAIARHIKQITSCSEKRYTALMSGKTPMLVFDTADLDSAVESAVKSAWYNQGAVPWAVKKLIVQESVFQVFVTKLKRRLQTFRIGQPFDKLADLGPPYEKETIDGIAKLVAKTREAGIEVFQVALPDNLSPERYFTPTVLIGEDMQANRLITDEVLVPVISVVPFRTAKEAVSLANNSRYGLAASIWLENLALSLSVADQLQVGTVWVNNHGLFDPAVPFGGWKESGTGLIGGLQPIFSKSSHDFGGDSAVPQTNAVNLPIKVQNLPFATTANATSEDVHKAVQVAVLAQAKWAGVKQAIRAQTLHNIAQCLDAQRKDLESLFSGYDKIDVAIQEMHCWAWACASEVASVVRPSEANTIVKISKEPLGVVGIGMTDRYYLLPLLSMVAAALSYGNAVVITLDTPTSSCGSKVFKALADAIPSGLVKVLSGDMAKLMETLTQHQAVDGIWFPGCPRDIAKVIENHAAQDMKRLCLDSYDSYEKSLLEQRFTQNKAVWLPKGCDIC